MGELLSTQKRTFDPHTHLQWRDLDFSGKDDIKVTLKTPKTASPGGDLVILFEFPDKQMCPVTIFQEYQEEARAKGLWDENQPVFRNTDGTAWAKFEFQAELNRLMATTGILKGDEKLACHSFRAGIPSMLAALGTPEAEGAAKEWGRWRSKAYLLYTKHQLSLKKNVFRTISRLLLK